MPTFLVKKHHTLVIEYTTKVEAPYASADTPERMEENRRQRISAESIANGVDFKHWDTNHEIIEEAFEFVDAEEVTTEE